MPRPLQQNGTYPLTKETLALNQQSAYPLRKDFPQSILETSDFGNNSPPIEGKIRDSTKQQQQQQQQQERRQYPLHENKHQRPTRRPILPRKPSPPRRPMQFRNPYGHTHGNEAYPTSQKTQGNKTNSNKAVQETTPGWVAPVVATAGVIIFILIIILIISFIIRRRRRKHSENIEGQTGVREYKVSNRAPIAPPRPEVTFQKKTKLEKKESAEYAYIYPDDVKPDFDKRRESNDPLPLRPGEYLDVDNYNKGDYLQPIDGQSAGGPTEDDYIRPTPDPYMYGRLHKCDKRDNSYAQLPQRQISHENKAFDEEE